MRDVTAAIAASVIKQVVGQVFFPQQRFLIDKRTSYTKHLSPYIGRISE